MRSALAITLIFAASAHSKAQETSAFEQGNHAFHKGQFKEAITNYQAQVESGHISATLHFNLANASFQDGQLGRAIFHYREAQLLEPRDTDIAHNLSIARNEVHNGTPPKTGLWQRLTGFLTLNEWSLLAVIPLTLWMAWLAAINIHPAHRKNGMVLRPILGVTAIMLALIALITWRVQTAHQWAVVKQETTARFGPVEASPSRFKWFDGSELNIERTHGDWLLVRDATGRQGWVPTRDVLQRNLTRS
jgi:tetratricopeptide (TPR) repeat protein